MTQDNSYAVMDVDRSTIVTSGSEITRTVDGTQILVAEEGQNVFHDRNNARVFMNEHFDSDGFGPELVIVELQPDSKQTDYSEMQ